MKLYYSPGACSLSPHIVACEAELPIELIKVDLGSKQTETGEDFWRINPNGYVPVLLLDDGNKLSECPVILQYLADLAPDKKLAPENGTFDRYLLQQWLNFISSEIHKNFSPLFDPNAHEAVKEAAVARLTTRLKSAANHLAGQPYLLGKEYSVADVYLFVALSWGRYVDLEIAKWPALARFVEKISARPAVQKALQEED
ncbi:glutathione transferase GstA [Methylomarinum vadi]|uniref:glutathione transferase GstA n=1 Tax=Methylomarinum vadi TaxID=438855 RepID=UPI0004DF3A48|nr:glutathione transferase GstA [Methylomarinum vadi]